MKREHPYWTNYSGSENGSVFGSRGGLLAPILHNSGYYVMTVRRSGIQRQERIHRFVYECFNGLILDDRVINHKDGNKLNNNLENLELVTNRENIIHCWRELGRVSLKGEDSPQAKITQQQAEEIIFWCSQGKTNKQLGNAYGLHPNYISLIRHNKRWKHLPR